MHCSTAPAIVKHDTVLHTGMYLLRRYAVALCCLLALAVAAVAGADPLSVDSGGAGTHGRIDSAGQAGLFAARLSEPRHWLHWNADDPIVRIVVVDVDRDGDSDVVAETRHAGLHFWINSGRGHFARRWPRAQLSILRAHHAERIVRGVEILEEDDSALNDPNPLPAVLPSGLGDALVAGSPVPLATTRPTTKFAHCRRDARGPPLLARS